MNKKVLILCNQDDRQWIERLNKHVQLLIKAKFPLEIDLWDEGRPDASGDWFPEFETDINRADVIIVLASKSFFLSKFMQSEKLKKRLKMKQEGGFPLFILLLNKCPWKRYSWTKNLPVFPGNGKLLSDLNASDVASTLTQLTEKVAETLNLESKVSEGILAFLQLNEVGPVRQLTFEPNTRLNIITGDNGLGKTFFLECAWWMLSGQGTKNPVYPRNNADINEAQIRYQLMSPSGEKGNLEKHTYNHLKRQWAGDEKFSSSSGLVVYARVNGTFAVWDPVKGSIPPPHGGSKRESPLVFGVKEIFAGIKEDIPGNKKPRSLCNGLIDHWIEWQRTPNSPFRLFQDILKILSTSSQEPLEPGEPVQLPHNEEKIPSLRYPYGLVPITYVASSVQRILSLAYFIVWTWESHKSACEESRISNYKNMVILIDEVESHLHPQWQRTIVPSLLEISKSLDEQLNIQFLITSHSPLVMASIEPSFDEEKDRLFHLDFENMQIIPKEQRFYRHGRVDYWYISETFGLRQARSLEAEKAIGDAQEIQQKDNPTKEEIEEVHIRLTDYLSAFDAFWPRWTFFAEQHGVET